VSDQQKTGRSGPSPLADGLTPEFVRLLNDLNQAFTVMGAHLLMFAEKTSEPEPRYAAEEAFRLSRGLMADAMHRARPSGCADVCKCTLAMIRMMGPVHRAYRTQLSIPLTPLWVPVDAIVLRRVVMNLLLNALEVSPPDRNVMVQVFRAGDRVSLVFDDAGVGIETISKTGHGLAFVQDVVADAGGYLSLGSSQRGGTRVIVDLPLIPAPAVSPPESE
jgi:signal transduction histidine kinase